MPKSFSPKLVSITFSVLVLAFLLTFYISAWTEPGQAPPGGNVSSPLNVGNVGQEKAGGLILNTGGAANGLIVDKGNVGIGTTNPGAKLDVNGNIKITDGTQGSGKVLTSDASGVASWQAVAPAPYGLYGWCQVYRGDTAYYCNASEPAYCSASSGLNPSLCNCSADYAMKPTGADVIRAPGIQIGSAWWYSCYKN